MSIEVSNLYYYPIKSCAGVSVDQIEVVETGFKHDREWMVVDADGKLLSQRSNPEMALIVPRIIDNYLHIDAPSLPTMPVTINLPNREEVDVVIHKKSARGLDLGDEVAGWFSQFLHQEARLVQVPPASPRTINGRYHYVESSNKVGFADGYPFLLTSEASLLELNTHLDEPIPMNRFRPNIVVSSDEFEPYEEDYWRELRIGELQAFVVRACVRCPIPDTDQTTGKRNKRLVTAALRATRQAVDLTDPDESQGNFFGQNLNHVYVPELTVKVGDQVQVSNWSSQRNIKLL